MVEDALARAFQRVRSRPLRLADKDAATFRGSLCRGMLDGHFVCVLRA